MPNLGLEVASMLLHAVDKGKVPEVLQALEAHEERELRYQHPDIRGLVIKFGVNPSQSEARIARFSLFSFSLDA